MTALLASTSAAVTVAALSWLIVPARTRLSLRLRPYAALSRSRLGTGSADLTVVRLARLDDGSDRGSGRALTRIATALGSLVGATDADTISLRLRHAGADELDVDQYRIRQLAHGAAGVGLGAALGITLIGSVGATLAMALLFGFPAVTLQRNRLERAITARRARMRSQVPTVAQLLAVRIRIGHGPIEAVRSVSARTGGPVSAELSDALTWISNGMTPHRAYDRLAESTAEPVAARLYRLLAASVEVGGDITGSLMSISHDVRNQRRDEIARAAVRRRTAMLAPLLMLIAPVMVLFVGAALPSMVLGSLR